MKKIIFAILILAVLGFSDIDTYQGKFEEFSESEFPKEQKEYLGIDKNFVGWFVSKSERKCRITFTLFHKKYDPILGELPEHIANRTSLGIKCEPLNDYVKVTRVQCFDTAVKIKESHYGGNFITQGAKNVPLDWGNCKKFYVEIID